MRVRQLLRFFLVGTVASTALLIPVRALSANPNPGTIVGRAVDAKGNSVPHIRALLFDSGWHYLRDTRAARSGQFTFSRVPAGTYWLQFQDLRPRSDVRAFATTNVRLSVAAGRTTARFVVMKKGAFLWGTVKAHGKASRGARVVAASPDGSSYETKANSKGQWALGGLTAGSYWVWAYDGRKGWTGGAKHVRGLKVGKPKGVQFRLNTKAGGVNGYLYAGGNLARGTVYMTVVNRRTGQWWVTPVHNGDFSVKGLAPGRYRFVVPGTSNYLGATISSGAKVRSGRSAHVTLRLSRQGGFFVGTVVDQESGRPLQGATVSAYDRTGALVASAGTSPQGAFWLGGSIPSQGELTVVVQMPYSSRGRTYHGVRRVISQLRVTTGRNTQLGLIALKANPKPVVPPPPTSSTAPPTTAPPTTAPPTTTTAPPTATPTTAPPRTSAPTTTAAATTGG